MPPDQSSASKRGHTIRWSDHARSTAPFGNRQPYEHTTNIHKHKFRCTCRQKHTRTHTHMHTLHTHLLVLHIALEFPLERVDHLAQRGQSPHHIGAVLQGVTGLMPMCVCVCVCVCMYVCMCVCRNWYVFHSQNRVINRSLTQSTHSVSLTGNACDPLVRPPATSRNPAGTSSPLIGKRPGHRKWLATRRSVIH